MINLEDDFKNLSLLDDKILNESAIKIQKIFRGFIYRLKRLPNVMYNVQNYLIEQKYRSTNFTDDGRTNSALDEKQIINKLEKFLMNRIKIPTCRHWYDILLYDYKYGWLPVNIKTSTTKTSDNTGNMAMCVYSYTDQNLDLDINKKYKNGNMSDILFTKLKKKEYNKNNKKDYYFIVINKIDNKNVIINSVKGLSILTANTNNLPFQIQWNKNDKFCYSKINNKINLFINTLKKPNECWSEKFMKNIRTLD